MSGVESAASLGLDRAALVVVLFAQLVVILDFSIVNVALPRITRELSVSSTSVQWVVTTYAITFGGVLVLGGRVTDLFGRRRLFIAGLIGFALASAAGGVTTFFPMLVASRAVQGMAAAVVAPAPCRCLHHPWPLLELLAKRPVPHVAPDPLAPRSE